MATSPRRFGESDDGASDDKPPSQQPAVIVSRVLDVGAMVARRPVAPTFEVGPPPSPVVTPAVPPPPPSEAAFDDAFFDDMPDPIPRGSPPPPLAAPPLMVRPTQRPTLQSAGGKSSESLWDSVEALLDDVDAGFGAIMGDSSPMTTRDSGTTSPAQDQQKPAISGSGGLSDARSLFGALAASHVRNVRDFMIDLETGQATSEWIAICEPAIRGVRQMAEQLELGALVDALERYGATLRSAAERSAFTIESESRGELIATYAPLVELMPQAFALGNEKSAREGIIVQSLLLQIPEVRKVTIDKLYSAGLTSLEVLFVAKADEVQLTTGIALEIAVKIVERFKRYKKELQGAIKDESRSVEKDRLAQVTADLKKAHLAFEDAERAESSSKKRDARKARDAAVLEIKVLLARLGEVERLQKIEKLPFAQKLAELDAYLQAVTS